MDTQYIVNYHIRWVITSWHTRKGLSFYCRIILLVQSNNLGGGYLEDGGEGERCGVAGGLEAAPRAEGREAVLRHHPRPIQVQLFKIPSNRIPCITVYIK